MMRRAPYVIIFLFIILSACSKQKQQGEEYFPEPSKGTQWDYSVNYVTPKGTQTGTMSMRVEGEETINGKVYYKLVTTLAGGPGKAEPQISYNRRTKEGIYKLDGKHKDQPEFLLTPFPIAAGHTWVVKTPEGSRNYSAERVETVDLASQKFKDCLKVSFQGNKGAVTFNGSSYLAPGVGEVKTVLNIGEVSIIYSLVKFKP